MAVSTDIEKIKEQLQEDINKGGEYASLRHTLKGAVEVNGVAKAEGIAGKTANKRIVGYRIKNNGDKVVPLALVKFTGEGPGMYQRSIAHGELKPGEDIVLSRASLGLTLSQPQFGSDVSNGRANYDKEAYAKAQSVEEKLNVLRATGFAFTKISGLTTSDPRLEIVIDRSLGDKKYELLPEYVEQFGDLANGNAVAVTKDTVSEKEAMAFYIYTKAKEQGMYPEGL